MLLTHDLKKKIKQGHLGGSVSWVSDFSPGYNFMVCEFEPRIAGVHLGSSVPPLGAPPLLTLSLSKMNKH